jgi:hypothetical protein
MAVVSITRLRLRSWRFLPEFILYSVRSKLQADKAPGNRGVRAMREPGNIFWTATAWDSEDAVKKYMLSHPHSQAMRRLLEWCDEASLVRWTQDSAELPDWHEAHRRMQVEGRRSKVNHPSADHQQFKITAPKR